MDPVTIAKVFNDGHTTKDEAILRFVRCAAEWTVDDIVRQIPAPLESEFKRFILNCPRGDIPVIGLDVPALKEEWLEQFKLFYSRMPS